MHTKHKSKIDKRITSTSEIKENLYEFRIHVQPFFFVLLDVSKGIFALCVVSMASIKIGIKI
jgi:hypothetical protein